jgi:cytochrome b
MDNDAPTRPVRVWDFWTRLFHWALVTLLVASYVTAEFGEFEWHMRCGFCVLALLLFRVAWGVVGSDTARFSQFLRGPGAVWHHLRGFLGREPDVTVGHNPAGGWAVMAILLVLCVQVATGLFADDDISEAGPFAQLVDRPMRRWLTGLHHKSFNVLLGLAALHVAAIGAYWVARRQNLVWPMVTGVKWLPARVAAPRLRRPVIAGVIFAVAAWFAVWVASFGD